MYLALNLVVTDGNSSICESRDRTQLYLRVTTTKRKIYADQSNVTTDKAVVKKFFGAFSASPFFYDPFDLIEDGGS